MNVKCIFFNLQKVIWTFSSGRDIVIANTRVIILRYNIVSSKFKEVIMTQNERYLSAKEIYAKYGVDTEAAIEKLSKISC